jgi:Fe-S-cluster-containing dehydrogenase component
LSFADSDLLREVACKATIKTYRRGEVIFRQSDPGDAFYLVRSGGVKVHKRFGSSSQQDITIRHLGIGQYFGEMALLNPRDPTRTATITAMKTTEVIALQKADFDALIARAPDFKRALEEKMRERWIDELGRKIKESQSGNQYNHILGTGIGEGTNVLFIDETKCIRCDQCVTACADTHHGYSRLQRTEGPILGNLLIPTSCRHCENPMCLSDCPPGDAIRRDPNGEVYIVNDKCIGCGNCAKNCPYDAIQMAPMVKRPPTGPIDRLLDLIGIRPAQSPIPLDSPTKAMKCDLCREDPRGPACVRICPTGAVLRYAPHEFLEQARGKEV